MIRDISGLGSPPKTEAQTGNSRSKNTANEPAPAQTNTVSQQSDVELSSQAKNLNTLTEKISTLSDVNESRVAQVKAALERNEFKIDNQQLADKLLAADDFF